jgi:aryl-phospho-beta-D-glucosidase BglC (GH1 family)
MEVVVSRTPKIVAVLLLSVSFVVPCAEAEEKLSEWWYVPYPEPFDFSDVKTDLTFIHVEGNRFVDGDGNVVIFRGVNISDPDKLVKNGRWSKAHFEVIKEWGANIVRVPVHPVAWKGRGKEAYFMLLDQAVVWASEVGLYMIIEWHGIGNLKSEVFQHPMHETTKGETCAFWRAVAHRYAGIPTVAFYELFNEPTLYNGQLGEMSWLEWKALNEEMIRIIFAHDTNIIPLVGGFNWAYELHHVRKHPIEATNIGYVSHPYPMKTTEPFEVNWERDFGYVADTYPVFATEIGFMAAEDPGAHVPVIADEEYGKRITAYFGRKGISWTVWNFDPDWPPQMISDWDYTPTTQGSFFRDIMQRHNSR